MASKLIQPPSMAASRGAVPRRTGNAKVFLSFRLSSFSDKPFRNVKRSAMDTSQKHGEVAAMVGLDAMKKANSRLDDFFKSYSMFHQLEPQSIFTYLPVLSFTESYIYQMDDLNEKIVSESACGSKVISSSHGWNAESPVSLKPLEDLLEREGLLTQRIQQEFRSGEEYWALERQLCYALSNKNKICLEDVMRADNLRSFYHRVLNLLLYKLRGEEVNELHMEFLSKSAFLVEVADDLVDYEEDVLENNFNILRMFVGIFGSMNAPTELAKRISEAEEAMKSLEEAIKEGGKISGFSLGTWNIPAVISNEEAYRAAAQL
ncbi:Fibrillin-5 [Cardamine amara subsp. amara]|uniref:Fibrillin-5 n=1 Tax=Cardamine amara subsp. amara TaxID=228776 RepID=A0ABD1BYF7_CARAN